MKTGDIVLIPFPFAEFSQVKARPAVVVSETADKYHDIIVAAISSVVPETLSKNELLLKPDEENGLRVHSVLKIDRIVTAKKENVIIQLGKLSSSDKQEFIKKFQSLAS